MDFDDLRATTTKDAGKPTRPIPPHGIHQHGEASVLDGLHINQPRQLRQISRRRIEVLHKPLTLCLLQRQPLHLVEGRNAGLDLPQPLRVHGAAVLIPHFEAVVPGRVVAGRDIHRADGLASHHAEGNRWRGHPAATGVHRDAIAS